MMESLTWQVRGDLQDTQKKVENSKADITRIKNELVPMEVRGGGEGEEREGGGRRRRGSK